MPVAKENVDKVLELLEELRKSVHKKTAVRGENIESQSLGVLTTFLDTVISSQNTSHREHNFGDKKKLSIDSRLDVRIVSFRACPKTIDEFGILLKHRNESGNQKTIDPFARSVGNIYIGSILKDGFAYLDGRLKTNDEILQVNTHIFERTPVQRARHVLQNALLSGQLCLIVLRKIKRKAPAPPKKPNEPPPPPPNQTMQTTTQQQKLLQKQQQQRQLLLNKKQHIKQHDKRNAHNITQQGVRREQEVITMATGSLLHSGLVDIHEGPTIQIQRSDSILSIILPRASKWKRQVFKMHIAKGRDGLGIQITGGKGSRKGDVGIFISRIEHGKAAHKDGRLKKGDELLMINRQSLIGVTHQHAVDVLRNTGSLIQLVVATKVKGHQDSIRSLSSFSSKTGNTGQPWKRQIETVSETIPKLKPSSVDDGDSDEYQDRLGDVGFHSNEYDSTLPQIILRS